MNEQKELEALIADVMGAMNSATSGISDPQEWLVDALGGNNKAVGMTVNPYTAMGLAPLWYAVNKISGHIATMPLKLMRRTSDLTTEWLRNDPRQRLIERPNDYQTAAVQREQIQGHTLLMGNGRMAIVRDEAQRPVELIPILPQSARTMLVDGKKWTMVIAPDLYDYSQSDLFEQPGRVYYIPDEDCVHIQGFGWNGVWGYSLIHICREIIGLGLAGQQAAGQAFVNAGRPGIILEAPVGKFRDPQKAKQFLNSFDDNVKGIDNAGKTAMLREGVTARVLPISQSDAQFLQQRVFNREEIALIMNLENILGDSSGVTYKSITERNAAYLANCLNRWLTKWEQEMTLKLLTEEEKQQGDMYFKFDTTAFLSGDPNAMADYTGKLRAQGLISGNEGRGMHHLNFVEDPQLETFTNPNTTTNSTEQIIVSDDESGEDIESERETALFEGVVRNTIKRMTKIEDERLSVDRKNYQEWLAKFYDTWAVTLGTAVEDLGANSSIASQYCNDTSNQLREIVAMNIDEPCEAVMNHMRQQGDRADALTIKILDDVRS